MKKACYILLLKLICLASINTGLCQIPTSDSTQYTQFLELATTLYEAEKLEEAEVNARKSLEFAESKNYKSGILSSQLLLARILKSQADYPNSLEYYLQILSEFLKSNDTTNLANTYYEMGVLFNEWNVPEKALENFILAYDIRESRNQIESMALTLQQLAITYIQLKEYDQALADYHKLLKIYQKQDDNNRIIRALKNISTIYTILNKQEEALKYNLDILKIYEKSGDDLSAAVTLNNIGAILQKLGKYEEALIYFNRSLDLNYKLENRPDKTDRIVSNLLNIGVIHQHLGDYRSAMKNFTEAHELRESSGTEQQVAESFNYLASVHFNIREFDKSKKYTLQAINIAKSIDNKSLLVLCYERMILINEKIGNYSKALEYYKLKQKVTDEIRKEEQQQQQELRQKQFDIEKTEKDLKLHIVDEELKSMELRNLQIQSEKEKQEYELLLREKEFQNVSLTNEQLQTERALQDLLLKQRLYESETKDQEIALLQKDRDLKQLELQQKALFEKEQQREIELQQKELALKELALEKSKTRQNYLIGMVVLFIIILTLIYLAYHEKKKVNEKLRQQNDEIQKQKERIEFQKEEITSKSDELEHINQELLELNDEKNNLIGIVAHDLKSPLNNIEGLINLIKLSSYETFKKEDKDYIDKILNSTMRLRNMISRILDVNAIESRTNNLDLQKIDLSEVLKGLVTDYQVSAEKKDIKIMYNDDGGQFLAVLDKHMMREVLENLISNAIKFSPKGKYVFANLFSNNGNVRVSIKDEGPGLSNEDMKKLFGKYQKLSARPTAGENSTGLGLSIVKKYVEVMNGKVWCESELGNGANFIVEFKKPEV